MSFLLGFLTTWFVSPAITEYYKLQQYEVGVTYTVAFFSLMLLQKAIDAFGSVPADRVGTVILDRIKQWFGVKDAS